MHELVCGPLTDIRGGVPFPVLDKTFNPTLVYWEGNLFNFGSIQFKEENGNNNFIDDIRDENGNQMEGSNLYQLRNSKHFTKYLFFNSLNT